MTVKPMTSLQVGNGNGIPQRPKAALKRRLSLAEELALLGEESDEDEDEEDELVAEDHSSDNKVSSSESEEQSKDEESSEGEEDSSEEESEEDESESSGVEDGVGARASTSTPVRAADRRARVGSGPAAFERGATGADV